MSRILGIIYFHYMEGLSYDILRQLNQRPVEHGDTLENNVGAYSKDSTIIGALLPPIPLCPFLVSLRPKNSLPDPSTSFCVCVCVFLA